MPEPAQPQQFFRPSFWRINFLVWFSFGVIALLIRYIMHQDFERALGLTLAAETLGFLLSGVLRFLYLRYENATFFRSNTVTIAVIVTLITAIIQSGLVQIFIRSTGWALPEWNAAERWILLAMLMWLVYLAWTLGYLWVRAEVSARDGRLSASEAKVEAHRLEARLLRAQLDPHFLFNSLNGIGSEIAPHPTTASNMVRELADYLRFSLEHRHEVITPLSIELDATAAYLRVEKTRFGDRLQTKVSADRNARTMLVPSFLLQPLVENAVKHGFSSVDPPWTLSISARAAGDVLTIEVANSGDSKHPHHGSGLGLESIRRRLELHYPSRHRFELGEESGIVTVRMILEGAPCFA
jgi:two-component system, LytTR family, sensor kinase